jgi:dTDP-4-amino-4,6-dideoxygalactose transaminase
MGDAETAAAAQVVRSGWLKGGKRREELEETMASDQGFRAVVAVSSCTQAIHVTLRARFPQGGARVAVPAYVCRSVWDAVKLSGCVPVLVDTVWENLGPRLSDVEEIKPDAVIVAHLCGVRSPVEDFLGRGWFVIEDCAQRIEPGDRPKRLDPEHVRVFSFEATKVITCGEGGALATQDLNLAESVRLLREGDVHGAHGACWTPFTDLQAAVALVQWSRLRELAQTRRHYHDYLRNRLPDARLHPAMRVDNPAPFRFLLVVSPTEGWFGEGSRFGVAYRKPVAHGSLAHLVDGPRAARLHDADRCSSSLLSIPCQPSLSLEQVDVVCQTTSRHLQDLQIARAKFLEPNA